MVKTDIFDRILESEPLSDPLVDNLAELIFKELSHRDETSDIIYAHHKGTFLKIDLSSFRFIIASLYSDFKEKNISPNETVLVASFPSSNPLYSLLLYTALTSYGVRVLMPTSIVTSELKGWIRESSCTSMFFPYFEIQQLPGHENEKHLVSSIKQIAEKEHLRLFDTTQDFPLDKYLSHPGDSFSVEQNDLISSVINQTNSESESTIFTTSGTSGNTKLCLYKQGSLINCCMSWNASGLYDEHKLGGRCFIDFFPHTISVRALFNAIWTGKPLCLITTQYLLEKPLKTLGLLKKMKPETMTLGPSSFNHILHIVSTYPLVKSLAFNKLKTVVSTGTEYDCSIADKIKKRFDLVLHNAYGTTETQQVLTTVIDEDAGSFSHLGLPLVGVSLGLKKVENDLFKLFVKSPFGCSHIFCDDEVVDLIGYWDTGDIVRVSGDDVIEFVGREKVDFFNTGYGLKISVSQLQKYHKCLIEQVNHVEYFINGEYSGSMGLCVMMFVNLEQYPSGPIVDKKILDRYRSLVLKLNEDLHHVVDPFELLQVSIVRFMVVNGKVPVTIKGTVSRILIESEFKDEVHDLIHDTGKNFICNV